MHLPYVQNPPEFKDAQDQTIVERLKQRRGDAGLLELDLTLLHAPPVADGWNSFLGAIRTKTTLSTSIRETAICRIAVLNKAWFEWDHHAPLLKVCPGMNEEQIASIVNSPPHEFIGSAIDEQHRAVMAYTDAMTLDVCVPDIVFERLKNSFGEREVVEITATIAAYNCVSRFLVALDVGERNEQSGPRAVQATGVGK
ncbi:4-carboxymuconolactone decarboxylase-like protein [Melanomma pulvis-pyrius CBS 109.77]|uniref:4-carboxymuconolactone decarboxylase-like protein n=1 Tax=Melanomma pulvis-pyrius CBS 109.77 TaxID=1314802 RepID=A0A6A6WZZ7_9PLEO|nr:4-carboxymuconolactone decarboxylase-like protein [Melanomma pulvis-pyrius CBS 109.77]